MSGRAEDWLEQAKRDLAHAGNSRTSGDHEWACRPRPSSPSAGATYLDRAATVEALRRAAREALRRDPRIVRVILFGSLVRGVPTPASDADLVVVLREAEPRRMDRIPPLLDAFDATPLPLDLHPYTAAEWEAARAQGDPVAAVAERDGIDLL